MFVAVWADAVWQKLIMKNAMKNRKYLRIKW
jgi:hypothetical protein